MDDITPSLLKIIQTDFQTMFDKSSVISNLYAKVRDGTATYMEANEFAIETGDILAKAFKNNISSNILPDGKMYYNIAERIISPMMENNYELIADVAQQVQKSLNEKAGIGIKAIKPDINQDRIEGIVNKVSSADTYDDVAWVLDEPIKNFSQSIVDDSIKTNAEFHTKSGLQPVITRKIAGDCCEWCQAMAGTYQYPDDVPHDVYRRHQRCRCTVDYVPGNGKIQNVHTKKWQTHEQRDRIEVRKNIGIKTKPPETPQEKERRVEQENRLGLVDRIAAHPKMLQAYTPKGLKASLEKAGYEVKPMNEGNFKGIPFEEGGGFKVNFGGDGILMYHPEARSHHGGAYYKISTGKGGRHRYDTSGNEIKKNSDSK